jgi:dihydroorotate dehydrogenase
MIFRKASRMSLFNAGFSIAKPFLMGLDAEQAHRATIKVLSCLPAQKPPASDPRLHQELFGLDFPNPLGLAPGFDKNAEVPNAMLGLGFGFVEVGTVTPKPQVGNPKPRLFRLPEDHAVINRMGFNNDGHAAVFQRLNGRKRSGIIGINIGANKDSVDRAADYVAGIKTFGAIADYITVNISSPNTPGLRGLQSAAELESLLSRLNAARDRQSKRVAMLLKIAPDLVDGELADIAACCSGGTVDGVIISNTTLSRHGLSSQNAKEAGGLSGRPLRHLATRQLAKFRVLTKGTIPLIGVGGIEDTATAFEKIRAGASLIQIYSAMVYEGPSLVSKILADLTNEIQSRGFSNITQACGIDAEALAHQTDPGK